MEPTTSKKEPNMHIEIDGDNLFINKKPCVLPATQEYLEEIIGSPSAKSGVDIVWKELGISTSPDQRGITNHITIHTAYSEMDAAPREEQEPFFSGVLIVDGKEIGEEIFESYEYRKYEISSSTDSDGKHYLLTIEYNEIFDKDPIKNETPKDLYKNIAAVEDPIEFKDFKFKLCVIQILMYEKNLIEPRFDVYEYVKQCKEREINLEDGGYESIPEITKYFEDLQISKKYIPEITEIRQDGSNEIYLNLVPNGNAEEFWVIESAEDINTFPALKKATLIFGDQEVFDQMKEKGVDVKWI